VNNESLDYMAVSSRHIMILQFPGPYSPWHAWCCRAYWKVRTSNQWPYIQCVTRISCIW